MAIALHATIDHFPTLSHTLDCYRKGVRLALAKKDMTTADMAFNSQKPV